MAEFATKGVAGAGLGLGIAGTALGMLNGGLGNLLGTGWNNGLGGVGWNNGCGVGWNNGCCASENMPVNRYEATQQARIAELETEVKLRDANTYTMQQMGALRDYVDHRFGHIEHELCDQRVYNATANATIGCIQNQVNQLMGLTKLIVPNGSICPGWGEVTVTPAAATTGT